MAAALARLAEEPACAQPSKPVDTRIKSVQDRLDGLTTQAAALRAERLRLRSQLAKLDMEVSEAEHSAGERASELQRLHRGALAAGPARSNH